MQNPIHQSLQKIRPKCFFIFSRGFLFLKTQKNSHCLPMNSLVCITDLMFQITVWEKVLNCSWAATPYPKQAKQKHWNVPHLFSRRTCWFSFLSVWFVFWFTEIFTGTLVPGWSCKMKMLKLSPAFFILHKLIIKDKTIFYIFLKD